MVQSGGFIGPSSGLVLLLNPEKEEKIAKNSQKMMENKDIIARADAAFVIKRLWVQK